MCVAGAFLASALLALTPLASGAIISRDVGDMTIDGDMTDWGADFPNPGDPAIVNVGLQTGNDGQFSTDAQGVSATCPNSLDRDAYDTGEFSGTCNGLQSVGRDLRTFAFTYDADNVYLFVERFANASNMTDWWFYVDTDDDGLMESTDLGVSGRVARLESVHEALYVDLLALERFGGLPDRRKR